jgi:methyl-accepting chemotaxis protein
MLKLSELAVIANDAIDSANAMQQNFLTYLASRDPELVKKIESELKAAISHLKKIEQGALVEANKQRAKESIAFLNEVESQNKEYLEQEQNVATYRANCTQTSGEVASGLSKIAEDMSEAAKKGATKNDKEELAVHLSDMLLGEYLLMGETQVGKVLAARDNFVNATADIDRNKFKELLLAEMGKLKTDLEKIKPLLAEGEFSTRFDKIMEDRVKWEGIATNYVASIENMRKRQPLILAKIKEAIDKAVEILEANKVATDAAGKAQKSTIDNSRITGLIVSVVAILAGVIICIVAVRNIVGGFQRAVYASKLIADDGNVAFELSQEDLNCYDEVGDLARAFASLLKQFQNVERLAKDLADGNYDVVTKVRGDQDTMNIYLNKMLDQTNNTLHEINEGVKQVATSSSEVSTAATNLANGAQEAAASLEQITASMSEIGSQTRANAEGAVQARDLAQKASNAASEGQSAMQEMTGAMERITKNSHEIQRVIKVIDDIAFQTNLLALNAAVEAARAGAHGKGFAVVAEEVRNLAARSAKAAQETSELIAKSGQEIEKGGQVASRTADVLNTIVEEVKETTQLIVGIATASNEQAEGVNQVTVGLQQIDSVTQQNTAAAEESASAANEMSAMATKLQKLVKQFKLRR